MNLTWNRQCSRCPRIDNISLTPEEAAEMGGTTPPPYLRIEVDGVELSRIEYLCGPCRKIVDTHLHHITKTLSQRSSLKEVKRSEEFVPVPPDVHGKLSEG